MRFHHSNRSSTLTLKKLKSKSLAGMLFIADDSVPDLVWQADSVITAENRFTLQPSKQKHASFSETYARQGWIGSLFALCRTESCRTNFEWLESSTRYRRIRFCCPWMSLCCALQLWVIQRLDLRSWDGTLGFRVDEYCL